MSDLTCPICQGDLLLKGANLVCKIKSIHKFPIIKNTPVLLNESRSLFSIAQFIQKKKTFYDNEMYDKSLFNSLFSKAIPNISANLMTEENHKRLRNLLLKKNNPKLLVIGDSQNGQGLSIVKQSKIEVITSDVTLSANTDIVCDAHDLPFKDNIFDGVIVQAVLEHVLDPERCVEEIYRVLKKDGYVYSSIPFMQQVHGGKYDFKRYSMLGHKYLFRNFKILYSGVDCGPGMALAWSYKYFLLSFSTNNSIRLLLKVFAHTTSFYLKYFDRILIRKPNVEDGAASTYILGSKKQSASNAKTVINSYRGSY